MLRLLVYPQPAQPAAPGTYRYINAAVGPFQRAYFSTQTFPFRVRGTQVCVLQDNQPQSNALIYRLQTGAERGGQVMGGASAPGHSDTKCYLIGRGQLGLNDRLLALLPILHTAAYDVYYTSPVNPSTGLPGYTVAQAGVQTVTVSSDNSLVLFGLDVALEWDASKDTTYLTQLQYDLNRTSELLYGWSNGQAAARPYPHLPPCSPPAGGERLPALAQQPHSHLCLQRGASQRHPGRHRARRQRAVHLL